MGGAAFWALAALGAALLDAFLAWRRDDDELACTVLWMVLAAAALLYPAALATGMVAAVGWAAAVAACGRLLGRVRHDKSTTPALPRARVLDEQQDERR